MNKIYSLSFLIYFVLQSNLHLNSVESKCPNTEPNSCEYGENTKRFYVMGPSGVGKSTFINVMTGHKHDENQCFIAGFVNDGSGGVTKNVKDEGCFHLLNGAYPEELSNINDFASNEKIILIHTPGLNDAEIRDAEIIR